MPYAYEAAATAAIEVRVLTSHDRINGDTVELLDFMRIPIFGDILFRAGEAVRKMVDVLHNTSYWKVTVENLDTTDMKVIVTVAKH